MTERIKAGGEQMENKLYEVTIPIDEYTDNAMAPCCIATSYEAAIEIARPWVEQDYCVVLSTIREEE